MRTWAEAWRQASQRAPFNTEVLHVVQGACDRARRGFQTRFHAGRAAGLALTRRSTASHVRLTACIRRIPGGCAELTRLLAVTFRPATSPNGSGSRPPAGAGGGAPPAAGARASPGRGAPVHRRPADPRAPPP